MLSPADLLLGFPPWAALAPGHRPANALASDVAFMFHPWLVYAVGEIGQGRFPLWNPHAFAGAPFFANPQTALLFPLTAMAYLLPPAPALGLIAIAKLVVAGVGMFWFLRLLGVVRIAAAIGGVTFMLNGLTAAWLSWTYASTVVLVPLVFALVERVRTGGAPWVAALALAVASDLLAGYPQGAFLGLGAAGVWAVVRAPSAPRPVAFLARAAAGSVLGAAIAAVHLLPFLEYARESALLAYRADWMPITSLPLRAAVALVLPDYYVGPGASVGPGAGYWGPSNINETAGAVGPVAWVVLLVAPLAARRQPGARFFGILAAMTAAAVYGLPLASSLPARVPLLSWAATQRLLALTVFALCALCGLGVDACVRAAGARRPAPALLVKLAFGALATTVFLFLVSDHDLARARQAAVSTAYLAFLVPATVAAVLVLRLLRERRTAGRYGLALLVLQVVTLAPLVIARNPVVDARLFFPSPPAAISRARAEAAAEHGRVALATPPWNTGLVYGFREPGGYDGMTPSRIEQLVAPGSAGFVGNGPLAVGDWESAVVDLLAVRAVVVPPHAPAPAPRFALAYDGPDGRVYRNTAALPRAFVVRRARRCVDDAAALAALRSRTAEPAGEAILAACDAPLPSEEPRVGAARFRRDEAERVVLDVETDRASYVVLTDTWFPGWRAWVDGAETRVWRADHAFRAVWVPPGRHVVDFRYRPGSFRLGLGVTLVASVVCVVLMVSRRWSRRT